MKRRVISGAVVFAILVLAIASRLITPYIFDALLIVAGTVATLEVVKAFASSRKLVNEYLACTFMFVMYIGILFAILNGGTLLQLLLYFGIMLATYFVISILISIIFKEATKTEMLRNNYTKSLFRYSLTQALRTIFVLIYPALLFAILIVLNHLDVFYTLNLDKEATIKSINVFIDFIIIATFVCSTFTDTFAMLIGSKVRGPKLCPKLSPNKTISGAIGGWLMGAIGILSVYMLYSLNADFIQLIEAFKITWLPICIFAILAPILAQVGDLTASAVKRANNIKDYSNLIPGHGGIMDRLDGTIFVAIVSFVISVIVCL